MLGDHITYTAEEIGERIQTHFQRGRGFGVAWKALLDSFPVVLE